ncbi:hypothetical protein FKG94_09980 [Exilibacterium tricleocarpae]|uniref:Heme peroxidase n=1 Tax=Exilibacterium tricleocarpae TaxID=2591008 RepID=A0A545TUW1_9GAMM|nr:peroxidase family protein [Exilibacterium tricleocarpae]TQV81015.1 hypothetical protein FKG94_09980 [Exilibacterium tricleocarpae]
MGIVNRIFNIVSKIPYTNTFLNRYATNRICTIIKPRPRAFSLWSHQPMPRGSTPTPTGYEEQGAVGDYTTWPMLTNRLYFARHLPPADPGYTTQLPEDRPYNPDTGATGAVTALFRREGSMKPSRSSLLFMFFAQWFTDSVLRVDPGDRRKNTSNHNIDLCQIYGLTETAANALRSKRGGKLRSQHIDGAEYPDYLGTVDAGGHWQVKEHYRVLPYTSDERLAQIFGAWPQDRKHKLYATGLDRGNSSIGYVAISTLFLREHNRICDELHNRYPAWDDERLFQTARMINTVILMKLVIEEYINHIAGLRLFKLDHTFAERQAWYRTPWIALEFDLLYRWHGLIPDQIVIGGRNYDHLQYRVNNALFEAAGLGSVIQAASVQAAGAISLQNVPEFMLGAEYATVRMGRDFRLRPYNDYRRQFGFKPLSRFDELTDDAQLIDALKGLYNDVNQVEFIVGMFAQGSVGEGLFGDLLNAMVAYDAFTQIYTNPLLSQNVYNAHTFSDYGLQLIEKTTSLADLVHRNLADSDEVAVRFAV